MAIPQIPDWRERILAGVGVKPTQQNLEFFDAWARAEGGSAANNPFNTTQQAPGATSYNSVGVRNYTSPQEGIDATVNTLTNGRYGNIIGALRKGDSAMSAAQALANSPWGTGALVEKILGGPAPTGTPTAGSPGTAVGGSPPALDFSSMGPSAASPLGGGSTTGTASSSPTQRLQAYNQNLNALTTPSPFAVRMLSALGDATKTVAGMQAAQN